MAFNIKTESTRWKRWLLPAALLLSLPASAVEYQITIKAHHFVPDTLQITTHERHRITVFNQDDTPEEFERYSLNREKVVAGKSKIIIFLPPLAPGEYPFFGEFNQKTAQIAWGSNDTHHYDNLSRNGDVIRPNEILTRVFGDKPSCISKCVLFSHYHLSQRKQ